MAEGGEHQEVVRDPLERIADALEKIADDPQVEIEAGPAFCPNCGTFNPEIQPHDSEGTGDMEDFVLMADCMICHHTMFAIVESWSVFNSREALLIDIEMRKGGNNDGNA